MAVLRVALLVLVFCVKCLHCEISGRFIVQVTPHCSSNGIDDGYIDVIADMPVQAKVLCADGIYHTFNVTDAVTHRIYVSYPGHGTLPCVFNKRRNVKVYTVKVVISQGETGQLVHEVDEEYTVCCTYSSSGMSSSVRHRLPSGYLAPLEIQNNVGAVSNTTMELQLRSVTGEDLTGATLHVGKKVWLWARSSGDAGEVGVKVVSCDAVSVAKNKPYPILRAGCGDGQVFSKYEGFTTQGLNVSSPYFGAFNVEGDPDVKFRCNFTLCYANCDGTSCLDERKRRSTNTYKSVMRTSTYKKRKSVRSRPRRRPQDANA